MIICGCLLGGLVWAWPLLHMCTRFWEEPILSSGVLKRTLSYIWLRLYLPMFLFNVALLTLMYMASFMVLARPWSSLPMMLKLLVFQSVSSLLDVHMDGRGLFQVLLVSFTQRPWCFPYVLLITGNIPTLVTAYDPTLLVLGVLVLWFHKYLLDGCVAIEICLYAILTTDVFETFSYALCIGNDHISYAGFLPCVGASSVFVLGLWVSCEVLVLPMFWYDWSILALGLELLFCRLLLLMLSSQLLLMYLFWTLLRAQLGY